MKKFTCLLVFCCVLFTLSILLNAATEDLTLKAPDGTTVTIYRDGYGVPHIVGESEVGVFFGQGFAVAQDRLYQMERNRRAAEGKLAEWYGPLYINNWDKYIRTMFYTKEERIQHFNSLPTELQVMLESYRDGINTYLDSMAVNPSKYTPKEFNTFEMEPWTVYKSIAIMHYMIRDFGRFGGDELDRLSELQTYGKEWLDQNRPINDPSAPTTIPDGGFITTREWSYSGMYVREEFIQAIKLKREKIRALKKNLGLPEKFGSFAVLITGTKSSSGNVMLLGCPQMGAPEHDEPQVTNELELHCPTLHVGGMTVAGVPAVIIGHNEHHAWSLTSGISDNCDIYIDSTYDNSYSKYYHNGEWLDFEVIQDTIISLGSKISFTHYRTIHGPVIGDDLANNQVFSLKMTFWNQELDMAKFVLGVARAKNFTEFEAAASLNPMSFNLFYAGKDQKIKFYHTGKYQDRSDGVDPRLPHKGDSSEEWGGIIAFADLPMAEDPAQGYFVNWNNKPVSWWDHGDNVPWIGSHRVTAVDNFVRPISGFTYDNLKDVPRQINDHGTYQQAIEFSSSEIFDENIVPPGQSGFIDLNGVPSPHCSDQWPLHLSWKFKDMEFGQTPSSIRSNDRIAVTFSLSQNYPNPFNPVTTILYQLPVSGEVVLAVYNVNGQLVKSLVQEYQTVGDYEVQWNVKGISSGVYFYRINAGEYSEVRKCMVLK